MSRVIYCTFFKKKALGLDFPCFPGKLGQRIYDSISKEAWLEWQKKQTMIINEYKLNMLNISDRKKLEKAMVSFLFKEKTHN